MHVLLVALMGCALGGCATTAITNRNEPFNPGTKYVLSSVERGSVVSAVTAKLKDPESARFGEMIAWRTSKGFLSVCGTVNAKNSFGGYTGMQPFTASIQNGKAERVIMYGGGTSSSVNNMLVTSVCENGRKAQQNEPTVQQ